MAPILPIVMGLSQVAPIIARWLGGENAGQVAEKVVGIAQVVTGAVTPEEALQKIQADAKLASDFQIAVMANEKDLEAMYLADRASAREREKAVRDRMPAILAIMVTVGYFATLAYMMQNDLPAQGREPLLIMLGSLGTAWGGVIAYYFGTTSGSARKTELIAKG